MRDESRQCRIGVADAKTIAEDLNEFVVTLDQIGSRFASNGAAADLLLQYVLDRRVAQRLAQARGVIFNALETELGPEVADEIGEAGYRYLSSDDV